MALSSNRVGDASEGSLKGARLALRARQEMPHFSGTHNCDVCKLAFRTRPEFVSDAVKAKQQLQSDFDQHECKPEDGAIDDALAHIR